MTDPSSTGGGASVRGRWPRLPLTAWLVMSHGVVLLLPLAVLVGSGLLAGELRAQTREDLTHQAALLEVMLVGALEDVPGSDLYTAADRLTPRLVAAREQTLAGIRVVDHEGVVVISSGDEVGEDLSDRPEVASALQGAVALSTRPRPAPTANRLGSKSRRAQVRLHLGVPLRFRDHTVGAIVLARTPREELQAMYQAIPWWAVGLPVLLTGLLALVAGRGFGRTLQTLARSMTGSLEAERRLRSAAQWSAQHAARSRVAEVASLGAAFEELSGRLTARLDYIGEFAAHVSHEFKTPIATLRGTIELLADEPDMPMAQRERFLDNAHRELLRLEKLLTGLLSLARAEQSVPAAWLEAEPWVAGVVEGREPVVQVQCDEVQLWGSVTSLTVVLNNLLDNAARYGGKALVSIRREGDVQILAVKDDGPGVPAADVPRLFERFFTTGRASGGTGVGLALVRTLMHAQGGTVAYRREEGWSVFEVRWPLSRDG